MGAFAVSRVAISYGIFSAVRAKQFGYCEALGFIASVLAGLTGDSVAYAAAPETLGFSLLASSLSPVFGWAVGDIVCDVCHELTDNEKTEEPSPLGWAEKYFNAFDYAQKKVDEIGGPIDIGDEESAPSGPPNSGGGGWGGRKSCKQ